MQISCKCLNITIHSRGSIIDNYDFKPKGTSVDHPFFKKNIGCVELERVHKEQASLVTVDSCEEWLIHRCLNCQLFTHALNTVSTAVVLVNRTLLTKPQDIAALKNSEQYSSAFKIVINCEDKDENSSISSVSKVGPGTALHRQLSEWLAREAAQTEERVRQYSEQQYAALDRLHTRAHREHRALIRILSSASTAQQLAPQFTNAVDAPPFSPPKSVDLPQLPDPATAISKKPQISNSPRNLARKPSVDAEGLFDLDGMDNTVESDDELTDTDDSGSHDEGIHIPRHVSTNSMYAKSLPVNVPTFGHSEMGSSESPDYRIAQEPGAMDIAASIKALAKSVHGDAVFGDLPRPRFSSQI